MSTAAERNARAAERQQRILNATQNLDDQQTVTLACADALVEVQAAAVQRLQAAVQVLSLSTNPNPILHKLAVAWIATSKSLVDTATAVLTEAAAQADLEQDMKEAAAGEEE